MKIEEFDYILLEERIAQRPLAERDASKLLVLGRADGIVGDYRFRELPKLLRGDELLVFNNTRVIPARLFGKRRGFGGQPGASRKAATAEPLKSEIEVLLTRRIADREWEALVRPGRKIGIGERIVFGDGELEFEVIARGDFGVRRLRVISAGDPSAAIDRIGHIPLPPYIRRDDEENDRSRYQTVFAKQAGAVAAPTAGLHFTQRILDEIQQKCIETCEITLDVGLGTFQPIHETEVELHKIHTESYEIPEASAARIRAAKLAGRPVLAVGTTVVRTLEDAALKAVPGEFVSTGRAEAGIYILPGHRFQIVDQLLTNFHLPRSSLLVLVAAFAGRENILEAYRHALGNEYRFFSYGDCTLIR
jgi:S-adenosylmethionine:tRNA ribosyltransferase-isomerase